MKTYPKISIVTPNYNGSEYIEETILSILNQKYPNLEYIIIDGGSTDGSIDIIKKYEQQLAYWVSEPDKGLYHALQRGFDKSTGEIMGWLNSDDILHPKSLYTIAEILSFNEIDWLQGIHTHIDEYGRTINCYQSKPWSKLKVLSGDYKWIQQESTFWSRTLWNKAGSYICTKYKLAGDFELWTRFFQHAELYNTNSLIGGFRIRSKNQLSLDHIDVYEDEANKIIQKIHKTQQEILNIKQIKKILLIKNFLLKTRFLSFNPILLKLQHKINTINNFPPIVAFDRNSQKYVIKKRHNYR